MTGNGHSGMEIGDGATASARFIDRAFGKATGEGPAAIRRALLEYCGLDTRGTVDIVEELRHLAI